MRHLIELNLSLVVSYRASFVDGTELVNHILNPLVNLRALHFSVISERVGLIEELHPSPAVLTRALIERGHNVCCYTDYNVLSQGHCHLYSLPFTMDHFRIHSHRFPGGSFASVRYLYAQDFVNPFEHEFFVRIAQSFPSLERFGIFNPNEQQRSTAQERCDEPTIEFPRLSALNLGDLCVTYAKQFLFDRTTRLPSLHILNISFRHLTTITENFSNAAARGNCANVQHLILDRTPRIYPENFYLYLPSLSFSADAQLLL